LAAPLSPHRRSKVPAYWALCEAPLPGSEPTLGGSRSLFVHSSHLLSQSRRARLRREQSCVPWRRALGGGGAGEACEQLGRGGLEAGWVVVRSRDQ
jgi:hypothetical protein